MSDAKRVIDVEDVVRWACERLPTTRPSRRLIDREDDPLAFVAAHDRELVGRWLKPAAFPQFTPMFAQGFAQKTRVNLKPPEDALTIEAAIRALPAAVRGIEPPAEIGHGIGFDVDVDGAWMRARAMIANLVLVHGRLGNRPCIDHAITVSPVLAANGKPAVLRRATLASAGAFNEIEDVREVKASRLGRDVYEDGAYCRLEYEPDPQSVVNDRAEWMAWRLGLDLLVEAIEGTLTRFAVMSAAAPWARWASPSSKPTETATASAARLCQSDDAAASALDSDGWFRVSLAWMIFAVAVQTRGLGFLLVAAM